MVSASYDSVVEEVKRRLNIIDLIQNYVSLKRSGKGYVGLCPFHDDTNPSMHVSEDKGLFHCFSCGAGGDIFGFMMRYNNLDFRESLTELAKIAGVEIKTRNRSGEKESRKSSLLRLNNLVSKFYHQNLLKNPGAERARTYLKKRGVNAETAKIFRLGYASDEWNALCDYLSRKNIPYSYPEELGLISRRKDGSGYYDRFRDRVIFPIFDITGNVTGFGGRVLNDDNTPKYYNSQESVLYRKRNSFYGLNVTLQAIRKKNFAILVEGYFDLISLYANGVDNVISTLGTSFTTEHAKVLKRYTDDVVLLYDGDSSGVQSARKAGEIMIESGIMPRIAILPEGTDPDNYINSEGSEKLEEAVRSSVALPEYEIDKIFEAFGKGSISRQRAAEKLAGFISRINSSVDRTHYVSRAAGIFGFRESDIYSMMRGSAAKPSGEIKKGSDRNPNELLLLKIVLKYPGFINILTENNLLALVRDNDINLILGEIDSGKITDVNQLSGIFNNSQLQDLVSEAVFSSDSITEKSTAKKMLNHCIARLKLRDINEELVILRRKIGEAGKNRDHESEKILIKEYKDLVEKEKKVRGELYES